jgi:hypothetical protein
LSRNLLIHFHILMLIINPITVNASLSMSFGALLHNVNFA